jgi:hypothetical protein
MEFLKSELSAEKFIEKTLKEQITDANVLSEKIEDVFYKHFPKSFIISEFKSNIYPSIWIQIALGAGKSEFNNGIINNDPIYTTISIDGMEKDGSINRPLKMESSMKFGVMIKSEDPMYVFQTIKVPFRKTTGTPEKILVALDRAFSRLYDAVKANADKVKDAPFDVRRKL